MKTRHLKSREEARAFLAKHLVPVGCNSKGYPIYAKKDIDALNVVLPEEGSNSRPSGRRAFCPRGSQ